MLVTPALKTITDQQRLWIKQKFEIVEVFGFETRNKYEIQDENHLTIGFAAEQGKGILGVLARQFLGHWRSFEIHFFDPQRNPILHAIHPFRLFFQRLEVYTTKGDFIGALQQRFSILRKRFDVLDINGNLILEMNSPFFSFWTFPFFKDGRQAAVISKKWAGFITEIFTDKESFLIQFQSHELGDTEKSLILAAGVFVDLQYFENKAGNRSSFPFGD
jgi:uncharacterized protein YxjI